MTNQKTYHRTINDHENLTRDDIKPLAGVSVKPPSKKKLYIVRGVPGSGKTTWVTSHPEYINENAAHFEADMFRYADGRYVYNKADNDAVHYQCQLSTANAMKAGKSPIFVANTFIKRRDMYAYLMMAHLMDYEVEEVICEGNYDSVHMVSAHVVNKLKESFER